MVKVDIPLLSFVAISSKNIQQHTSRVNIHRIVITLHIAVVYISHWKDVYVIPFIFMSFIPEWVRNEEMTQKWRLSAGMRLASSQSFLVIRLIRRSSKTQNDSRMRKNVIFKSFPRNNQTQLSFVGKMFQLWDNGYRWASEWHRMTRKW